MPSVYAELFGGAPAPRARGGDSRAGLIQKIRAEAIRQGVDPALALAVVQSESGFRPYVRGDDGNSQGLFQLRPAAAIDAGIDPAKRLDPDTNITGGIRYLKMQLDKEKGNELRALTRYNTGTPTYRGIGTPGYAEHVLQQKAGFARYEPATPPPGPLTRASRVLSPARAEAAPVSPARQTGATPQGTSYFQELFGQAPDQGPAAPAPAAPAPPPAQTPSADPKAGYEVEVIPGGTPSSAPPASPGLLERVGQAAETAVKGVPIAGQLYPMVKPILHAQYGEKLERLPQMGAAGAISTTGAMLGTAAGTLAAPFTGPLAPAMPLVGEMAGSYAARRLNVGLGLEEPSVLGDVASVAVPGLFGLPGVVRGVRAGAAAAPVPRGTEQRVADAAARGVPLSYGDVTQNPMAQRAEVLLEQVPLVGTSGFRTRQQRAVTAAAEGDAATRQQAMRNVPWQGLAQVQQAAQQGNRQAQQVLDAIDRSGDDWSRIVQASGNLRAFRARQAANQLYGEVDQLAERLGAVPPERTVQTLETVLGELRRAVLPDQETIRTLEQMRASLTTTPRTYREMRQFDSDLGDMVRDYYQGKNAVIGAKGVGSFTRLRSALRNDLDQFAQQSGVPEVRVAHQRANRFYQHQVIPYEDVGLAKALSSDTPDEIYAAFIQRGHRDRAQKFYNALEPRGRAAVRYGMVAEALDGSVNPTTGHFSPARFASTLEKLQDARGVFFRGQDAWQVDGLLRVMRAAERAGAFTENPPTGQRVIGALIGAGAVMAPGTAAQVGATAAGLTWLLTSRAGSGLLLRAHRAGQDTLALDNVLREITAQGARLLATEGGDGLQEGTQVQVEPGRVGR